jgi:hypothetical protein
LSLRKVCVLEISTKFSIFLPNMTYFKEKKFTCQEGHFSVFKNIALRKSKGMLLSKVVLSKLLLCK